MRRILLLLPILGLCACGTSGASTPSDPSPQATVTVTATATPSSSPTEPEPTDLLVEFFLSTNARSVKFTVTDTHGNGHGVGFRCTSGAGDAAIDKLPWESTRISLYDGSDQLIAIPDEFTIDQRPNGSCALLATFKDLLPVDGTIKVRSKEAGVYWLVTKHEANSGWVTIGLDDARI